MFVHLIQYVMKSLNTYFRVLGTVYNYFKPQAVVCQCGADGMEGDPMASFNLSADALVDSVKYISS